MSMLKPYSTLVVGIVLGAVAWPMVRSRLNIGA